MQKPSIAKYRPARLVAFQNAATKTQGRPDTPFGWLRKAPSALSDLLEVEYYSPKIYEFSGLIFCCLATGAIPGQPPRSASQGKPALFSSARIMADSYTDLVFRVFRDEQQVLELAVTSDRGFRLPAGRGSRWQFELAGTDTVTAVIVASSMAEL